MSYSRLLTALRVPGDNIGGPVNAHVVAKWANLQDTCCNAGTKAP